MTFSSSMFGSISMTNDCPSSVINVSSMLDVSYRRQWGMVGVVVVEAWLWRKAGIEKSDKRSEQ